jgi:hypothetical protein
VLLDVTNHVNARNPKRKRLVMLRRVMRHKFTLPFLSFRAKSRMEWLGKPRHRREGRRLSERE